MPASSPPTAATTGIPTDGNGAVTRSDLNYDAGGLAVASNRLIVKADDDGDVCFYTLRPAALDRRRQRRVRHRHRARSPTAAPTPAPDARPVDAAGGVLRVPVPEALGGKTVIGQLTVDQVAGAGFVTAYACDDGMPTDAPAPSPAPTSTTTAASRRSPRTG